jgi:outer membrane lipoprotein-sorting protein/peroxiredoxin
MSLSGLATVGQLQLMKPRGGVACLTVLFLTAFAGKVAQAQLQPRSPGGTPALQRTAAQPAGWNAEIEKFLKRLTETYAKTETYRDQGRVVMVQRNGRVKTTTEMPMELVFRRPNRLLVDAGQHQIACDGKSLVVTVAALRQFTSRPAPERLDAQHLQAWSTMGGVEQGHPELVDFLIRPNAYELWQKQMTNVTWKPDATVEGITCRVLEYETVEGTRVRTYVDPSRMILLRVVAEATQEGQKIDVSYDLGSITLNEAVAEKSFSFTPPGGFRRVAQFNPGADFGGHNEAEHATNTAGTVPIMGKTAAPITARDLQGRMFTAEEMRGKVTLLFFWSLSGGQYSLISLPVAQQVADYFQNKPDVLVLGISGDPGQREVIAQLMERKKCKFRTVFDEELKLRQAYEIGGEPTFVVVSRDNKITWARLGAPPTLRQDLLVEIDKALSSTARK